MVITEKQGMIMFDIVKSVLYSSTTDNVAGYSKSDVKNLLNSIIEQCDDIENIVVKTIQTSDFGSNVAVKNTEESEEKTQSIIEKSIKEIETIVSSETLQKTVNQASITLDNPIGDEFDFGTPVANTPDVKLDFNAAVGAMIAKPKTTDFGDDIDVTEKYKPIENVEVLVMKETEKINTSLFDEEPSIITETIKETKDIVVKQTEKETKIESEESIESTNTKVAVLSADEMDW